MRPNPGEVREWFTRSVTPATIAARLTTLQADPNWRVRYTRGVGLHTFSLLYSPTGESIEGVVLHVGTVCYSRLDRPLAATA